MVKAELKNYRQSPRKVRIVADIIRGKKVEDAIDLLTFTVKRSATPLKKLLESAIANAVNNSGLDKENLFVKSVTVDQGVTAHRWMPRARGSAAPIRKRSSHVKIVLDEIAKKESKEVEVESPKAEKKVVKKATKAKTTKK